MFLVDDALHWSASDLTAAAECEYALLRTLDHKLGRGTLVEAVEDPLMTHIAALGDRHEAELLSELQASGPVVELPHVGAPYTAAALETARDATLHALKAESPVIFQAAFHDGEFFGYADFLELSPDGWVVCDAKLARSAKPKALLQLGAYADQLLGLGVPLSGTASLLLGNGQRADFPVADLLPVFRERRDRLRQLLADHRAGDRPVAWGQDAVTACGRCAECQQAALDAADVSLVAGLRMEQRRRLNTTGIHTVADLAHADGAPADMTAATFDKLRAQARLQWQQSEAGDDAPLAHELTDTATRTLALLPAPSPGDLFFDFEGDPMYDEGDRAQTGLEYLWGVLDTAGTYTPLWAHSAAEERAAFVAFMDDVAARRRVHPDLHIYHYAPYETSALKRLAMRYQTCEKELDDLLRSEVFVDLYAVVRGSVRVASPSYSIKKLEPLYMGDELRSDDEDAVGDGGASVVAYHEYRSWRTFAPDRAAARLAALEDYNNYDCVSTLRLRDWLLDRARDAGVSDAIAPRALEEAGTELSTSDPVFLALMEKAGTAPRSARTPEQQAHAMLATAIDYFRREHKQFWWEHFSRLHHPIDEWAHRRGVFCVESAEVVSDWAVPEGKSKNARRTVRLVGDLAPGSKQDKSATVLYESPCPPKVTGPASAPYGAGFSDRIDYDASDARVVLLTESRPPEETYDALPVALAPDGPPNAGIIADAIMRAATTAAGAPGLPHGPAYDVLARRSPRLRGGAALPSSSDRVADVVAALTSMDDSYLAIQGPPGTGKTYVGSRVIRELVEKHHWRVGVVGQSHAVVENMLKAVVEDAGLDPELVGKSNNDRKQPPWTDVPNSLKGRCAFLESHAETGCVLGGTSWTFSAEALVESGPLDLLVIDEAGQFALANTIGAATSAKRLLLLGDPQQLPQVSQGSHAEPVDASALGWLMGEHDTIDAEHGYFLADSFRMHPDLCRKVSDLSYEGRLVSAAPAAARRLDGIAPGLEVVTMHHVGNRTESPEEAAEVVRQVRALHGTPWQASADAAPRPLDDGDFLVVAPYNAQVAMIRRALDVAGFRGVEVGTVDRFQGKEAPIAIMSMTASSPREVPRGMGFLLQRNRVNVAISRAQWRAVLIRSAALTSYLPSHAHGLLELGAFIGLCTPDRPSVGDIVEAVHTGRQ